MRKTHCSKSWTFAYLNGFNRWGNVEGTECPTNRRKNNKCMHAIWLKLIRYKNVVGARRGCNNHYHHDHTEKYDNNRVNVCHELLWAATLTENRSRACWQNFLCPEEHERITTRCFCNKVFGFFFPQKWRHLFRVGLDVALRRSCAHWYDLRFLSACSPSFLAPNCSFAPADILSRQVPSPPAAEPGNLC